ncbi:hypothetical protein EV193_103272 [Herbihabitans rhizosphaerae]|uniref:PPE family protein n=1 Tax=Herbihabitans rhizosphaerae TaxID=1872711 RepID=A0A4Q7KW26_9PSEU|nr:hypothetical protein [Herbihabitans rhizosphaerae]RZS40954.1 hypothetical protein EV193_103272 [Herbihabitans rhizosphaerae]
MTTKEQSAADLLADMRTATDGIRNGDWTQAGMGGLDVGLDIVGLAADPLTVVAQAGFGFLVEQIGFLAEPFNALQGNPEAITSSSSAWSDSSTQLTQSAEDYQSRATSDTANWQGGTADAYRETSGNQASALMGLAEAGTGMAQAVDSGGKALAETRTTVLQTINDATVKIVPIMTQGIASAWATGGMSLVTAIVQSVQIAVQAGGKILGEMGKLGSALGGIMEIVKKVLGSTEAIKKVVETIGGKASGQQNTSQQNTSQESTGSQQSSQQSSSKAAKTDQTSPLSEEELKAKQDTEGSTEGNSDEPKADPGAVADVIASKRGDEAWASELADELEERGVDPSTVDADEVADAIAEVEKSDSV